MNESKHSILIFCQAYSFSESKVRSSTPVNRHQNAPIHSHLPVEARLLPAQTIASYKTLPPSPAGEPRPRSLDSSISVLLDAHVVAWPYPPRVGDYRACPH